MIWSIGGDDKRGSWVAFSFQWSTDTRYDTRIRAAVAELGRNSQE